MACRCTDFRGHRLDKLTQQQVLAMEAVLGRRVVITQGCCNKGGVAASAGTHDCEGVLDFSTRGLTESQKNRQVRAGRLVGLWGWVRKPGEGPWGEHHHAVSVGCANLAAAAARQVAAARRGRNGLANNGLDRHRGLGLPVISWERYLAAKGTPAGDGSLRLGDHGPAVAALQKALGITADGVFGERTRDAVNRIKRMRGLPQDGVAGSRVHELLGLK